MRNPVLRGDVRARARSRKIRAIELFCVSALALLAFLGLPPELSQIEQDRQTGLVAALGVVLLVLVTYFASACAAGEIAVEGEKSAVDLLFAPFRPATIAAGKSLSSLLTVLYWILLGLPILVLAAAVRRTPLGDLMAVVGLAASAAWGIAQWGLLYSIAVESEFARTAVHWATLFLAFVLTLLLPAGARWVNPVVAVGSAAGGQVVLSAFVLYLGVGLLGWAASLLALGRFDGAS